MDILQLLPTSPSGQQSGPARTAPAADPFARVLAQATASNAQSHTGDAAPATGAAAQAIEPPAQGLAEVTAKVSGQSEKHSGDVLSGKEALTTDSPQLNLADYGIAVPTDLQLSSAAAPLAGASADLTALLDDLTQLLGDAEAFAELAEFIDPDQLEAMQQWLPQASEQDAVMALPPALQQLVQVAAQLSEATSTVAGLSHTQQLLQQPQVQQNLAQLTQQFKDPHQQEPAVRAGGTELSAGRVNPGQPLAETSQPLQQGRSAPGLEQLVQHQDWPTLQRSGSVETPLPTALSAGVGTGNPAAGLNPAAPGEAILQQPAASTTTPTLATEAASGRAAVPVSPQHPAWGQQLGQQLVNMVMQGDNQLAIRLHPAELGPLMVNLQLDEQGAQLQFLSQQGQVRSAVEQALPQLRELLAQQGIELADAQVGSGSGEGKPDQQGQDQAVAQAEHGDWLDDADQAPGNPVTVSRPGIDLYA